LPPTAAALWSCAAPARSKFSAAAAGGGTCHKLAKSNAAAVGTGDLSIANSPAQWKEGKGMDGRSYSCPVELALLCGRRHQIAMRFTGQQGKSAD